MKIKSNEKEKWTNCLYFAYKKAKHFVENETSFVDQVEIITFEENLQVNIEALADLLMDEENKLKNEIDNMKGNLYFTPKSLDSNGEGRIRPKVAFPFAYQVLWAAVILRIGEWFDTNPLLKNVYSMREENIRKELDWMVPWSFNGRIKRLTSKVSEEVQDASYIQYNDKRLYESHQLALRKYHSYEAKVTNDLFTINKEVYQAELDIQEFFPTLKKNKIKHVFATRLDQLSAIDCFEDRYFNPAIIKNIINNLLELEIVYPDKLNESDVLNRVLKTYYYHLTNKESQVEGDESYDKIMSKLLELLNESLPLDLIASNFLSNCTLNYYIDKNIVLPTYDSAIYILRYTDDYTVISDDKRKIKDVLIQIKKLLDDINLKSSVEKTLPTTIEDIIERLNILKKNNHWDKGYFDNIHEWLDIKNIKEKKLSLEEVLEDRYDKVKEKLLILGIKIEPESIEKNDIVKELTMSRLSSSSDMNVHTLSDTELEMYMQELITYLKAKGDVGELKEETAKIFAAWRLNASYGEQVYRRTYKLEEIKSFFNLLEEGIIMYPYKLGYLDIYLFVILRIIAQDDTGYKELAAFLLKLQHLVKYPISNKLSTYDKQSHESTEKDEIYSSVYFPAIRIRVLKVMSRYWSQFNEEQRGELRRILEKSFLVWYALPRVYWEELYTMYNSFFIMRMRLPLHICQAGKRLPKCLDDIANTYNDYLFTPTNQLYADDTQIDGESEDEEKITAKGNNNIQMKIAIYLLKSGLYRDLVTKQYVFTEVDMLIYYKLQQQSKQNERYIYDKVSFAKIAPEKLAVADWEALTNIDMKNVKDNEFILEMYDFLQYTITLYFQKPNMYKSILDWSNTRKSNENNEFLKYVQDRFKYYREIRKHYSLTDESYPALHSENNNVEIPIADWVFYCQTLPYHLETSSLKQMVLHPLTEYEFIGILYFLRNLSTVNEANTSDYCQRNILFNTKINISNWEKLREIPQQDILDKRKGAEKRLEKDKKGNTLFNSLVTQEKKKVTEEYTKHLFSLLTNRPWHSHVKRIYSMYKWNDLQSYFEMTYYPSTKVASLFVNNLNIHQDFYSRHYHMPLEELPYRDVYTSKGTRDIDVWIKDYIRNQKNHQVYKSDNRKLELLEINIDQLRD